MILFRSCLSFYINHLFDRPSDHVHDLKDFISRKGKNPHIAAQYEMEVETGPLYQKGKCPDEVVCE